LILEQHYLACLAQASYLIVDQKTNTAIVVDPRRDVDLYVERAKELGVTIRDVILTHFHADFLAGHLELRERTGAKIWLGEGADAEFEFSAMKDGGVLEAGDLRLEFLATPGHTPESTSILVYDLAQSAEEPHAVLTGDTLFIGDVGRPDLMSSVGLTSEELAGWMYDSLRTKLMPLPDETIVYPGHGAGSACGKNLSSETWSTIGKQKQFNYALQDMERDAFVGLLTANQPDAPAYFPYDARLNRREHPTLEAALADSLGALSLDEVLRLQNTGAVVVDTRDADAFAAGHLAGSVNIGLDGKYASWTGTLIDPETPLVIVADDGLAEEATRRLGRIGFDSVAGHLEGGAGAFASHPEHVATHTRITPDELRARLASDAPPLVVDVRTPTEWEDGHIEGALHVPLARLPKALSEVPVDRDIVLMCKTGYRSSAAASLLATGANRSDRTVVDVAGGMDAWSGVEGACSA